jgi:hypothetical protein
VGGRLGLRARPAHLPCAPAGLRLRTAGPSWACCWRGAPAPGPAARCWLRSAAATLPPPAAPAAPPGRRAPPAGGGGGGRWEVAGRSARLQRQDSGQQQWRCARQGEPGAGLGAVAVPQAQWAAAAAAAGAGRGELTGSSRLAGASPTCARLPGPALPGSAAGSSSWDGGWPAAAASSGGTSCRASNSSHLLMESGSAACSAWPLAWPSSARSSLSPGRPRRSARLSRSTAGSGGCANRALKRGGWALHP